MCTLYVNTLYNLLAFRCATVQDSMNFRRLRHAPFLSYLYNKILYGCSLVTYHIFNLPLYSQVHCTYMYYTFSCEWCTCTLYIVRNVHIWYSITETHGQKVNTPKEVLTILQSFYWGFLLNEFDFIFLEHHRITYLQVFYA